MLICFMMEHGLLHPRSKRSKLLPFFLFLLLILDIKKPNKGYRSNQPLSGLLLKMKHMPSTVNLTKNPRPGIIDSG